MKRFPKPHSLRQYVRVKEDKDIVQLQKASYEWVKATVDNRLAYEIEWFGVPVIQTTEELIMMQELIYRVQPDCIVETGVAHGGSLIFYASLLRMLGKGKVVGIDIDIRSHNREVLEQHPFIDSIELIEGSSIDPTVVERVSELIADCETVVVCLDSNHTAEHVAKELEMYQDFVTPNSYLVVFDTITSRLADDGLCEEMYKNNGPSEAVEAFLSSNTRFEVDEEYDKLYVSYSPRGFLKRVG